MGSRFPPNMRQLPFPFHKNEAGTALHLDSRGTPNTSFFHLAEHYPYNIRRQTIHGSTNYKSHAHYTHSITVQYMSKSELGKCTAAEYTFLFPPYKTSSGNIIARASIAPKPVVFTTTKITEEACCPQDRRPSWKCAAWSDPNLWD